MKSLCCNYEFDVKYISEDNLGFCTHCPCCHGSFDVDMERLTFEEFNNLKKDDVVFVKIHDTLVKSFVLNKPFWNSDADEPDWEVETSNGFCDICSLYKLNDETEKGNDCMNNEKIKIKVTGGYIIAERNPDPDYDGISVYFETENGDVCDITLIECKAENNYNKIDVYNYAEETSEEWTHKFTLDNDKINKSFE